MITGKEIKNAIKEKRLVIGREMVIKNIKRGKISRVVFALNCPEEVKRDLGYYAKISKIKIEDFKGDSEKLGETCAKPFNILLLGIKK